MSIALEGINPPLRIVPVEPMSLQEFWQFAANNRDLQMERQSNGDVILMTPTLGTAGFFGSYINRVLGSWADVDGKGFVLDSSTGCELPDGSVLSADAAWIRSERWSPSTIEKDVAPPCPDFVIELRSKTDRLAPLQAKMETWIANGAELAWLIDPRRKTVEIYRPNRPMEEQQAHSAAYGEGCVGGFVLELGKLWS